jgi:hypothetical protein
MGLAGPKRLSTRNCRYGRAVIEKRRMDPNAEFLGGSNRRRVLLPRIEMTPENRNDPQTAERPRNEGSRRYVERDDPYGVSVSMLNGWLILIRHTLSPFPELVLLIV